MDSLKRWSEYTVYIFPTPQTSQIVPRLFFNAISPSQEQWREIENRQLKDAFDQIVGEE